MKFTRLFSSPTAANAYSQVKWKRIDAQVTDASGQVRFEMKNIEVPAKWSQQAANILADKYLRKAGVPDSVAVGSKSELDIPSWLLPSRILDTERSTGGETSAHQVFHRLAGCWTYWGWRMGLFVGDSSEQNAKIFYHEIYLMLANQIAAPNSPQWFNTGLHWAYGIEGPASGQWAFDSTTGEVFETQNAYERPQPHACFIQPVIDDLVNPGGILDLVVKEGRLFKQGSGTGTNFSNIRGKNELLSGGGKSSGLMSFLSIGDRAAGSIKSGGTTRRAAKMVILDPDHPEIEDFINWKVGEEAKAAAMHVGSKFLNAKQDDESAYWCPPAMHDRIAAGMNVEVFGIDSMEAVAIASVDGQNSNNSVRITDRFLEAVDNNEDWSLTARTDGSVVKTLEAQNLWTQLCRATWACADPGVQFSDTINSWHTCPGDGEIRASNPCSEYLFLDNTACNLASLNLCSFLDEQLDLPNKVFNIEKFTHAARLWTIVLDISVEMASFPSREIALGTYNYRTLGLGYSNLGGLLMRLGLAYSSPEGRALAAALTALMTGVAYKTSADLATELGAFPRWPENADSMSRIIQRHANAIIDIPEAGNLATEISVRACFEWSQITDPSTRFRNAQTTLIAPTGTISFVMDCDTTGLEPEFSLKRVKSLAGGGHMSLINLAVDEALVRLGYEARQRSAILTHIDKFGTVEGCEEISPADIPIFVCSTPPQGKSLCLDPMDHVEMLAAIQPFLSGAASKTAGLPNSATVEDIDRIFRACHRLGVKAIAPYRDGSKLTQVLHASGEEIKSEPVEPPSLRMPSLVPERDIQPIPFPAKLADQPDLLSRGVREYLPWRRESAYVQKIKIGQQNQSIFLTVSRYPDGRAGEIFLELSHAGTALRGAWDIVSMCISVGLQYGVPLEEYVDRLLHRKFEPAGMIEGHDKIKFASSIADYMARELGIEFLGYESLAQGAAKEPTESEAPIAMSVGAAATPKPHGIDTCPACGEASYVWSGTCQSCYLCGFNEGCG